MRIVYHGSIKNIESPLVNVGRENLDFGKGFYVTDIKQQAKTWAEIKAMYYYDLDGIINQYSFIETSSQQSDMYFKTRDC